MPTILIVGGYGNTGYYVAELLLQHTDAELILAGRNEEKARAAANRLRERHGGVVEGLRLDAGDEDQLRSAFNRCDLVVLAASTHKHVHTIIRAAIDTQTDYLDTQLSIDQKIEALRRHEEAFVQCGMTVVTDAGFHPGLPAALVRHAALQFDQLEKANVSSYMGIPWSELEISTNTMEEFAEELNNFEPRVLRGRKWERIPLTKLGAVAFDFGEGVGRRTCMPMYMHELEALPQQIPSLEETGFFISGFNWFTDNIVTVFAMLTTRMKIGWLTRLTGRFFFWSAGAFAKPPYVTLLQLEAFGIDQGAEKKMTIRLSHEDSYLFTAIPVVACILQYLENVHEPGFYFQSHFLKPETLLQVLSRLGIQTRVIEASPRALFQ
jgi:saccharopine dehydrogenase (NAD+, L-lysine-forming)